jgi:hypothetical protein
MEITMTGGTVNNKEDDVVPGLAMVIFPFLAMTRISLPVSFKKPNY